MDIIKVFTEAQQGNEIAMKQIIAMFNPLIQKCARKLDYEDGINDLVVFVIKFVKTVDLNKFDIDACLVKYFAISVKHECSRLAAKHDKISKYERLVGTDCIEQALPDFSPASDNNLLVGKITSIVSKKEGRVLYLHYIMDYSIADIAELYDVSRQAVN